MKLSLSILSVALTIGTALASSPRSVFDHANKLKNSVIERRVPGQSFVNEQLQKRASQYLNENSKSRHSIFPLHVLFILMIESEFVVDGTKIPDVPFDVGESYAGLLPISTAKNETRKLFFW